MSCFPESIYAFYVDAELAPDEVRLVETHLVQCRSCRGLVVALREEAGLLADVLHERARQSYRTAPRTAPPPRELALGLVPLVALEVVAIGVLGWIFESRLPSGLDWLNPFRLQGAYEMAFDLLFWIRDEVPQLLQLVVAWAGLVSVSMLLLFVLSAVSRRFTGAVALGLAVLALSANATPSAALDLHFHEDEVTVPAGETVDQTMIVNAKTVRVDGVVDGDLIVVLAERLIVHGEVRGNIFSSARTIEMSGKVTGNFHAIGETVRLDGEVGRNMYSISELLTLADAARVGRDSTHIAAGASIEGAVGRDLFVLGDWVEVSGSVARNVYTRANRVALLDTARVGGNLDALFWDEEEVEISPGAVVSGEVRSSVQEHWRRSHFAPFTSAHFYVWLVIRVGAAFLLGMLLYALVPGLFAAHLETAGALGRAFGIGFLILIATPIALFLVGITLLGIPIALVGLAVYLTSLYVSGILVAALLGTQITKPEPETWRSFGIALLVGLVIVIIATAIPFLGHPIRFVVVLTGLGLIAERVRSGWRATRDVAVG
jgi:cytoskeletal protein CcmA (bactofilin family)/anti-sigma factor RsiW